MSEVKFTMSDVESLYTNDDYKPARPELRSDTFFEWKVTDARLKLSKDSYIQVNLKVAALDADGKTIVTKFVNVPLPVAFKGAAPGEWAKGIFLNTLRPLFPELAPFDAIQEDAATGKNVYMKNGAPLKGKAYDEAVVETNRSIAAKAKEYAGLFVQGGVDTQVSELLDRTMFSQVKVNEKGYANLIKMRATKPAEVCYDRQAAFGK